MKLPEKLITESNVTKKPCRSTEFEGKIEN